METDFLDDDVELKVWMLIAVPVALCCLSCCVCKCVNKA